MAAPASKKPTLRTISQLSGLAVPTVSRALNDAPDIGQATKEKVRRIAREIGYVPNRAGVRLRTGKTNVISLVLGTDSDVTDHTGQLVSSIARTLRDTRYHMIVTPYFPDEDPMIPVRYIVETGSADAVILNRVEVDDIRVAYLMERDMPFVCYGRSKWRDGHPYFDFDNESFGTLAATTLITAGRRRLALVAPPLRQNYAQDMIRGASVVATRSGVPFEVIPDVTSDDTGAKITDRLSSYFCDHPDCDGMICPSTGTAIAAVAGAERIGRVIGIDLDVFAKDAIPFLRTFRPALRTARENVQEAGAFLARAAIHAVEHPDDPPMQGLMTARIADDAD